MDLLEVSWDSELRQSLDFSRICFNSSTGDDEAQELCGGHAENAFFQIELDVVCSEIVEREPQVVY